MRGRIIKTITINIPPHRPGKVAMKPLSWIWLKVKMLRELPLEKRQERFPGVPVGTSWQGDAILILAEEKTALEVRLAKAEERLMKLENAAAQP